MGGVSGWLLWVVAMGGALDLDVPPHIVASLGHVPPMLERRRAEPENLKNVNRS